MRRGDGHDRVRGGAGADDLNGGAGIDLFVFNLSAAPGVGAARDRIQDFTPGNDLIDVSDLGTFVRVPVIVAGPGPQGQVAYDLQTGLLSFDIQSDGTVDFEILLRNRPDLDGTDFLR